MKPDKRHIEQQKENLNNTRPRYVTPGFMYQLALGKV